MWCHAAVGKAGPSKGQVMAQIAAGTGSAAPLHGSEQVRGDGTA